MLFPSWNTKRNLVDQSWFHQLAPGRLLQVGNIMLALPSISQLWQKATGLNKHRQHRCILRPKDMAKLEWFRFLFIIQMIIDPWEVLKPDIESGMRWLSNEFAVSAPWRFQRRTGGHCHMWRLGPSTETSYPAACAMRRISSQKRKSRKWLCMKSLLFRAQDETRPPKASLHTLDSQDSDHSDQWGNLKNSSSKTILMANWPPFYLK